MERRPGESLRVDLMAGGFNEGRELGHRHLAAADEEGRHIDDALRAVGTPALDVVGEGVDAGIAPHEKGSFGDLHEACQRVVRQLAEIGAIAGELGRGSRELRGCRCYSVGLQGSGRAPGRLIAIVQPHAHQDQARRRERRQEPHRASIPNLIAPPAPSLIAPPSPAARTQTPSRGCRRARTARVPACRSGSGLPAAAAA